MNRNINNPKSPTTSEKQKSSDQLPLELEIDILSRLPAKSLARFLCVSKLYTFIIRNPDFINSFLTRSLTQPRILFTFAGGDEQEELFFFSSALNVDGSPSSAQRTKCLIPGTGFEFSQSVRGLICCVARPRVMICNPTTGAYITLPKVRSKRQGVTSFFGYDPIYDQYKVLCMTQSTKDICRGKPTLAGDYQVFTLGAQQSWRMIECRVPHCPITNGLCINGVLYYGAYMGKGFGLCILIMFDMRTEMFSLIEIEGEAEYLSKDTSTLINYKGKVALVEDVSEEDTIDLWVVENAAGRGEWSRVRISLHFLGDFAVHDELCIKGTSQTGEIIISPSYLHNPFYIIYYDVERNSFRRVEFEGIKDDDDRCFDGSRSILTFTDHAESIMFL